MAGGRAAVAGKYCHRQDSVNPIATRLDKSNVLCLLLILLHTRRRRPAYYFIRNYDSVRNAKTGLTATAHSLMFNQRTLDCAWRTYNNRTPAAMLSKPQAFDHTPNHGSSFLRGVVGAALMFVSLVVVVFACQCSLTADHATALRATSPADVLTESAVLAPPAQRPLPIAHVDQAVSEDGEMQTELLGDPGQGQFRSGLELGRSSDCLPTRRRVLYTGGTPHTPPMRC
jgi:hypothetical protein